ncbi:MAG: AI-2E family transporter, partial [Mesorhizobium sp.]
MKAEPAALGAGVAEAEESRLAKRADRRLMRSLLIGIFLFMSIYALYFARAFFMPVILAFLLTLTLTPIVRLLRKRGIPEVVSATLLVLVSLFVFASAGYVLSGPVIDLINNTSSIGQQLTERLAQLRRPVERIMEIAHQIEGLTETSQEPGVQKVAVAQSGFLSSAASNILSAGTSLTIIFVLSLFLLASGTMFY